MWKRTLLMLALGAAMAHPALAQQGAWEAAADPLTRNDGRPYCHMTYYSEDVGISFAAFPGRDIMLFSTSLEGFGSQIEGTLRLGNFKDYTLTMVDSGGVYNVNLTSDGMASVVDVLTIFGDEETRLTVGPETELIIPPDGAQDAARTMWDCRAKLPEG
ncbi:hypothetical protein [Salibaculum sp.]|uniref:hypothetical protein n=1 Tax=Salibaculum sp. TaxID=2855480 RepID=UPI002B48E99C|nr:hypothetical protein [Salibaculum sp.]HKL68591.1 hypothetical protein [Salibaculum sp.]